MPGGLQHGPQRSGVGGLIRLSGATAPFHGDTFFYSTTTESRLKERRGRGDTSLYPRFRSIGIGSSLLIRYQFQTGGTPAPAEPLGTTGNATFQIDEGKTITVPFVVTGFGPNFDINKKDIQFGALTGRITGPLVYAGWPADQPTPDAVTKTNQEQFDGTTKGVDPHGLSPPPTQRLTDIWGSFANTDAAEQALIVSFIASALPPITGLPHNYKLRGVQFTRDAIDGGVLIETWGLTTTAEDELNPRNTFSNDLSLLQDIAHTAAINASAPTSIAGANAFVVQATSSVKINDSKTLNEADLGLLTNQEKVEFPNTWINPDPSDLRSTWAQLSVFPFGSTVPTAIIPSGQRLRTSQIVRINQLRSMVVYGGAKDSTKEEWEQSNSFTINDPNQLQSQAQVARVDTPPSTTLAGFTFREMKIVQITHDHPGYIAIFGLRTTLADIEMPGTVKSDDPYDLADNATVTIVTSSPTPPATPTAPLGELVEIESEQQNDFKWRHTFKFANLNSQQKVEFAGANIEVDPSALTDKDEQTVVNSSSTPPATPTTRVSGTKLRRRISRRISGTPVKWAHTFQFDRRTTEDDAEMDGTKYVVDQSGNVVAGSARVTIVEADATPDGGVTVTGLVLRDIEKKQIHDSKWEITYVFGQTTHEEDIELPDTVYENDPSNLADIARVTLVNSSSTYPVALDTPPSTPTTATLKLRRVKSVQLTNAGRWSHTGFYGLNTEEDDAEMGGTSYTVDQSGNIVSGSARVTVIEADGTPDGGVTVSGLVLIDIEKRQKNDNKWAITYIFGQRTHEDEIEFDGTELDDDKSNIKGRARVTIINNSATTYPTALDTPPTIASETMQLVNVTRKQITSGSGMYAWTGHYSANTTEQEITFDATISVYSPLDFYKNKTGTVVATSGSSADALSAAALTANQSDVTFDAVSHKLITPAKAIKIIETTGADKIEHSGNGHFVEDLIKGRPPSNLMTGDLGRPLPGAWNTPGCVVLISRSAIVVGGPGGGTEGLVEGFKVWRLRGTFRWRRRYIVANDAAKAAKMQQGSLGAVNAAEFRGWPAHWVMYQFPDVQYCGAVSGGKLLIVDYVFGVDSWMWMSDRHISDGRLFVYNLNNPIPAPGYWDPTVYFHPTAPLGRLAWTPESDFTIFE